MESPSNQELVADSNIAACLGNYQIIALSRARASHAHRLTAAAAQSRMVATVESSKHIQVYGSFTHH